MTWIEERNHPRAVLEAVYTREHLWLGAWSTGEWAEFSQEARRRLFELSPSLRDDLMTIRPAHRFDMSQLGGQCDVHVRRPLPWRPLPFDPYRWPSPKPRPPAYGAVVRRRWKVESGRRWSGFRRVPARWSTTWLVAASRGLRHHPTLEVVRVFGEDERDAAVAHLEQMYADDHFPSPRH